MQPDWFEEVTTEPSTHNYIIQEALDDANIERFHYMNGRVDLIGDDVDEI